MKATIDKDGCLTITPKSGVETYALKRWSEQWHKKEAVLLIDTGKKKKKTIEPLSDEEEIEHE